MNSTVIITRLARKCARLGMARKLLSGKIYMECTHPGRLRRLSPDLWRDTPKMLRLVGLAATLSLGACIMDEPERLHTKAPPPPTSGTITIQPRQPLLPTFPCSRCHEDLTPNPTERRLTEFHTQRILEHGGLRGWCYRCHSKVDIDKLNLMDGTLVSFNEAYELCGSCHGDKLRDFKAGIHGLTTGYWAGDRLRRSCPSCHDPHSPQFAPMTPERAPARPRTAPVEGSGAHEDSHGKEH